MANTLAELAVKITADTAEFQKGLDKAEKGFTGFSKEVTTGLKVIGGAFTALGAAGLVMVSSSLKINAALGQTAITLGVTTKEMQDLALSVTDVSSPLSDVTATFELLAQAGIKNTEIMKTAFLAFDALGDVTGSTAETIASTLIPVFRAFGQELPTTSGELDKFTWLAKNTTVSISEFATVVQRLAPEMQAMGLSTTDAMIAIAGLEARGITGRKATAELGEAIGRAAESGRTLFEELGFTTEEVGKYQTALDSATGTTDTYAAASEKQYSIMDKVKQAWSELTLKASGFLEPLEPILAGMTALGPLMIFLSTSMGQTTIAWIAHTAAVVTHTIAVIATKTAIAVATAAQWLWNIAMTANPIGLLIAAIALLIAAVVLIAKNWDTVREKVIEIWNNLIGFFGRLWENIIGVFKGAWESISGFLGKIFEGIGNFFKTAWNNIIGFFSDVWGRIGGFFTGIGQAIVNAISGPVNFAIGLINTLIELINKLPFINIPTISEIGGEKTVGGETTGGAKTTPPEDITGVLPKDWAQHGGIFTKPSIIGIGEAGPEAVIPLNEAGGMGGITINFTQPVFFDREDTMNKFVDMIRKGIQRQDRLRFGGAYSG